MQQIDNQTLTQTLTRQSQRWQLRSLLNHWPLLVWGALTFLCLLLYVRTTQYGIITGTAQSVHHDAAPLQVARVKELYVQIGSHVTNGQVVAQMDTLLADAQVAEAEATLAGAQTTIEAYQGQILTLVRTLDDEILRSQHAIDLLRSQQESDAAKLAQLKRIQAERDTLARSKLIPEQLADALPPDIAWLEKQVAAYPIHLAMEERILEEHRRQRSELQRTLHLGPAEDIMNAVSEKTAAQTKVLETIVAMRKLERETFCLRSQGDGVVSDILVFPGVVAKAGECIVSIVSPSERIIGYLPEFRLGRLSRGAHGFAFRIGRPPIPVQVAEIIPEVDPVPAQLSPISSPLGATLRSQKIIFNTEAPVDITPGEKFEIRMDSEVWAKAKRCLGSLHL
jgi:multidrug resistance efflux pump